MRCIATSGHAHDWPSVTVALQCSKMDDNAERSSAERAAQRVSGVQDFLIELDVERPGSRRHRDSDFARSVETSSRTSTLTMALRRRR